MDELVSNIHTDQHLTLNSPLPSVEQLFYPPLILQSQTPSTTYHANSRKIHQMINAKLDQAMRDSFLHLVS